MKKILITGAQGQVGCALLATVPQGYEAVPASRSELDITSRDAVGNWVTDNKPAGIINAAAYTAVDRAEEDSESAFRINADGPKNLALLAAAESIPLVHISTDFVFDGHQSSPYKPDDEVKPLSVYGESKAKGEASVIDCYARNSTIVRTSWVYSIGRANFVTTMLRLMNEKESLNVVADQIGTPTWAYPLAETCWNALRLQQPGIYHWSDAGVASWFDFAVAIQEEALDAGLLERAIPIHPIGTADFPTPATRPSYSVLDKSTSMGKLDRFPEHWRKVLRKALANKGTI